MILVIVFWCLLFVIFYTYLGYGLLLYIIVKIKEAFIVSPASESDIVLPHITLLVAAYNEEEIAMEKIENSRLLDYPKEKLHLMWITDGSSDRTNEIVSKYSDIELLFQEKREGKSAAINRAIFLLKRQSSYFLMLMQC